MLAISLVGCASAAGKDLPLDDFEDTSRWRAIASDGVSLTIEQDEGWSGKGMRLDLDFHGGGGYGIARRDLGLDLPENYEFSFRIAGTLPPNNVEFKLIDATGDNVWWSVRREFEFSREWTRVAIRKRHIDFAWGPLRGGDLGHVAAIEIAISAGSGGRGSVWIDEIELTRLEPDRPYDLTPAVTASSTAGSTLPSSVLDDDPATLWRSGGDGVQSLTLDFLREREFGGAVVEWGDEDWATDYNVKISRDGERWDRIDSVAGSDGGRDYLFLPETSARYLRFELDRSSRGRGYAIRRIEIGPIEWSESQNDFFAAVARDSRRGLYPRYFQGEQSYWTIVGVDGDAREALVNTDGAVEPFAGEFSLEPFLRIGNSPELITWNDIESSVSLEEGYLPVPSVSWMREPLRLETTVFSSGEPERSTLWLRYRVSASEPVTGTLYVAIRPFQVNPPWQFLGRTGGVGSIETIRFEDGVVIVDDAKVVPLVRPSLFGAATFDEGSAIGAILREEASKRLEAVDDLDAASGFLAWRFDLASGETDEIALAIPLHPEASAPATNLTAEEARELVASRLAETTREWRENLDTIEIELPPSAPGLFDTIRATLAWILVNRDGSAIQPGSRSYDRSWIRDGSLTSAALLRLGHPRTVRDFIEWYAPYQYPNGKNPCCVDRRGADPVPENDSNGEFIWLVAEYYRYTGDRALLERMWPYVEKSAAYIDELRRQRMTEEYRSGEKRAFYGLMPESISHEGYSAKPMHSFWDDFFALRGLEDAEWIAGTLGYEEARRTLATIRDEFRRNVLEAVRATMENHGIDYIPGAVELGDFDATSTTIALDPVGIAEQLPAEALRRTFEKYWENFVARREGRIESEAYTPYEHRVVGSLLRLGWPDRARDALAFFLGDRRPATWQHWAEVVWRDPESPKFIGDMPHGWVGSDFIRSALDLFAFRRHSDGALVLGAGIDPRWIADGGIAVRGLRTEYGMLSYEVRPAGAGVRWTIEAGLRVPDAGLVLAIPSSGTAMPFGVEPQAGEVIVRELPATIDLLVRKME